MNKRLMIFLALPLFLALQACSGGEDKGPSTKEVVDKYVETVSTAKDKARKAAEDVEKRQELEERMIDGEDEEGEERQ